MQKEHMSKDNMKILEKFTVVRLSDLKSIADVYGNTSLFKGRRFELLLVGGWAFTLVFISLFAWSVASHKVEVKKIKEKHLAEMNLKILENDSLRLTIEEIERMEKFIHVCYEALTTKCPKATHDNIWAFVKKCDPWYPDIVMMQAVQESSCGKSAVGKRCNNLFGMTKPSSRQLRCDINRSNKKEMYAEYSDWRFSVIDRILWDRWVFRNKESKPSIDEYMRVIDNVYNTETKGYGTFIYKNAEKYRKLM